MAATMKVAVEKKNAAREKGALEFDLDISHERESSILDQRRNKDKRRSKKGLKRKILFSVECSINKLCIVMSSKFQP